MFKKLSLQWRFTLLSSLLIAVCCIGLTLTLNVSAFKMVDTIDAYVTQPAIPINSATISFPASAMTAISEPAKHLYFIDSIWYTLVFMAISGILTYYIAGKALQPLQTLNVQIKNVSTHTLSQTIEVPDSNDEISELTHSFNIMSQKLDKAFCMQKRFSADAAHELRTPLAVLQTKLDVFKKRPNHTIEEYEILIDIFQKQIQRLRNLVSELLAIANMEDVFLKEPILLNNLLQDVLSELQIIADTKEITIHFFCKDTRIFGNKNLLYRAFYNIVENAIKYNIPKGTVTIESTELDSTCIISITDTGIGIPDSMKNQIFEPFYRVDPSRNREIGGAGLGLTLANSIIQKHNGEISVSDNNKGGSCFKITIPQQ